MYVLMINKEVLLIGNDLGSISVIHRYVEIKIETDTLACLRS